MVRHEPGNPTETASLRRRRLLGGQFPVDACVVPSVDRFGIQPHRGLSPIDKEYSAGQVQTSRQGARAQLEAPHGLPPGIASQRALPRCM
jgi:hypothetical protein